MTAYTKVAELPELPKPDWKATDGVSEGVYSATQVREFGMACYQAALARQSPSYEALDIIARSVCAALERAGVTECDDPGESIDVLVQDYERTITRLSDALNAENGPTFMGEPALARQEAEGRDAAGYPIFTPFAEMLVSIINDVQNELGFSDEEKECSNGSLELVAAIRDLKQRAAPPSAPVGQKAVAWRYWSPSGSCWWTRYVAPTEDTSPESTNWEPLYAAPPAAQAVDLSDDFSESKDWRESDYNGRIDWLKAMHASQRAEIVRLQNDVEILRTIIDQQAGKGMDL